MEPENKLLSFVTLSRYCVWRVGIHKIIKSEISYIKHPSILFAQDWAGENPVSLPGTVPLAFILLCFFPIFFQKLRNNIFLELRVSVWCVFSLFDAFDGWTNCPKNIRSFLMGRLLMWPPWNWPFCCLFCAMVRGSIVFLVAANGKIPVFSWVFLMESRQLALLGAIGSRTGHHRCCPTNCLLENRF